MSGPEAEIAIPQPASPVWEQRFRDLVEDRNEVRGFIAAVLGRYGYRVLEAADGAEAVFVISQHPERADMILTDIVMPRMGGRELVGRLARLYPEIRVLYMSGYVSDAAAQQGFGVGDETACIAKPFTPEELARKVRSVLDRSSAA
ncbi:MAG TPA: response regulator [Bryobacteraceae bacterium]|jgi:CheY-like chemotaxis protein|nr:response regulator [Bryobacteraceae bacterium]